MCSYVYVCEPCTNGGFQALKVDSCDAISYIKAEFQSSIPLSTQDRICNTLCSVAVPQNYGGEHVEKVVLQHVCILQVQSRNVLFEMYCLMWAQPCTYTHQPCWPCFCIQAQGIRFLLLNTAAIKLRKCFAGETHLAAMKQCWSTTHTLLPSMCNMCYPFLVSSNAMAGSGLNST